ncbi:MAG: cyclopropane-fatty-acyl-phospholipid synthase family protein [Rhodovulum sp.]|jgi:cyclopropane-fatty-acyl-phospholipid synthase|nr:cyclopropane-fatty-acyl-phospholipid synthase family protein [Rhodovulum sp.]
MLNKLFIGMADRLIKSGTLHLTLADGSTHRFGDGSAPEVSVRFTTDKLPMKLLRNPELALGEAYMDQELVIEGDDVRGLLTLVVRNAERGHMPAWQRWAKAARRQLRKWHQWTPLAKARKNAEHHYEISTPFYELFLDESMLYTCAYFRDIDDTLEQAQDNKKHHIAKKLLIKPGMRVLDIGCGWGELGVTLARDYGANVVGVTLSEQQRQHAIARAKKAGVADKCDFRLMDYRDVDETFDRIVSVGMLEHVGQPQYGTYFRQVAKNLAEDGVALIHFIGRSSPPGNLSPWFNKYIFPGGYTPALSEVFTDIEKTPLLQTDIECWRTHYARTLYEWLVRFEETLDQARDMYDERFIRMWRYYLIASELSMSDMPHDLYQVQLAKRKDAVPIARDYLYGGEVDGALRNAIRIEEQPPKLAAE